MEPCCRVVGVSPGRHGRKCNSSIHNRTRGGEKERDEESTVSEQASQVRIKLQLHYLSVLASQLLLHYSEGFLYSET